MSAPSKRKKPLYMSVPVRRLLVKVTILVLLVIIGYYITFVLFRRTANAPVTNQESAVEGVIERIE